MSNIKNFELNRLKKKAVLKLEKISLKFGRKII